jgi:hypothetical protein
MAGQWHVANWFLPVVIAMSLLPLWAAMRAGRKRRLVDNLPTSKTTGVFIGYVEVNGTAECQRPLRSHLAGAACVLYSWSVSEHWSRTETETYTDSDGKTRTRTVHKSGWTTVADGGEKLETFYLRDDCGHVLVRPEGADIEPAQIFDETCDRSDALYYAKGPVEAIADSDHRRWFTESAIVLHAPLYVLGQARERSDVVAPEIAHDKSAPLFLISTRSEKQISSGFGWAFWGWGILGLLLAVGGVVALDIMDERLPSKRWPFYFVPAVLYGLAAAGAWVWMAFNSLVDLRQRVRQGWSLVDVQLKRRHDLIPNLVSAVSGLASHEKTLQTELAAMRSQLQATPPGVAGPDYRACAPLFVAVKEAYPDLVAQENFAKLQRELADTEQRIALARSYFNDIATHYNTRLEIVPDRFLSRLGAFTSQPLMAANDFERAPVTVDFAA